MLKKLLKTILSTLAITLRVNKTNISFYGGLLFPVIVFIVLLFIYNKEVKIKKITIFLSILFAIFIIIGNSYSKLENYELVFKGKFMLISIIKLIGYTFIFSNLIQLLYHTFSNKIFIKNEKSKLKNFFDDKPFIKALIVILISWLLYIISFYPAILSPDPTNQIKQFFGIKTKYLDSVLLTSKNVTITNHHPVLHTVLLGLCVKVGRLIYSDNFGLFLYSIIQIAIFSTALAYSIKYLKKLETPYFIRLIILLIYAFVPVFPFYAMSAVKDTIFTSLVIFYNIFFFNLIKTNKLDTKTLITFIAIVLLIMLLRNNGIYLVLMSLPFMLFTYKPNRKKILILIFVPLVLYKSFTNIILPTLKIPNGSIREMLSIPFQQTARYVKEYEYDLSMEDKKNIDKVLGYDTLKERYKPSLSDPVKNEFNKHATRIDMILYFKTWAKCFIKHPNSYIQATISNTYGYFYPNTKKWYIYYNYYDALNDDNYFNYHYINTKNRKAMRDILSSYGVGFKYIPFFRIIVNIAFSVWIIMILFIYLIIDKNYKYLIYLTPFISLILVCIASPANAYFRYAMPYTLQIPLIICMYIYTRKGC